MRPVQGCGARSVVASIDESAVEKPPPLLLHKTRIVMVKLFSMELWGKSDILILGAPRHSMRTSAGCFYEVELIYEV
jgi:hypothetical protein